MGPVLPTIHATSKIDLLRFSHSNSESNSDSGRIGNMGLISQYYLFTQAMAIVDTLRHKDGNIQRSNWFSVDVPYHVLY